MDERNDKFFKDAAENSASANAGADVGCARILGESEKRWWKKTLRESMENSAREVDLMGESSFAESHSFNVDALVLRDGLDEEDAGGAPSPGGGEYGDDYESFSESYGFGAGIPVLPDGDGDDDCDEDGDGASAPDCGEAELDDDDAVDYCLEADPAAARFYNDCANDEAEEMENMDKILDSFSESEINFLEWGESVGDVYRKNKAYLAGDGASCYIRLSADYPLGGPASGVSAESAASSGRPESVEVSARTEEGDFYFRVPSSERESGAGRQKLFDIFGEIEAMYAARKHKAQSTK